MPKRYDGAEQAFNREEMYAEHFDKRGVKYILQYKTFEMTHPTAADIGDLTLVGHAWSLGDRYYKLAHEYYGDSQWWWVIAWFNQKPTDSHVELGEVINIPLPLDKILRHLRAGG